MIHLYLSLPSGDPTNHLLVKAILDLDARVSLVQAASGDDEITRKVAAAHILSCDGLVAVISGKAGVRQIDEIRMADEASIPIWVLSDDATVDVVEDRPVRSFTAASFVDFVESVRAGDLPRP